MVQKFKVEHDVPLPNKRKHESVYPWATMHDGDSFFMTDKRAAIGTYTSFKQFQERCKDKLDLKVVKRIDGIGYRIWLVKK